MVEGNGLENRRAGNGTEGSNPSLSARRRPGRTLVSPGFLLSKKRDLNPLVRSQASLAGVYTEKDAQRVAKRSSLPLRHSTSYKIS